MSFLFEAARLHPLMEHCLRPPLNTFVTLENAVAYHRGSELVLSPPPGTDERCACWGCPPLACTPLGEAWCLIQTPRCPWEISSAITKSSAWPEPEVWA